MFYARSCQACPAEKAMQIYAAHALVMRPNVMNAHAVHVHVVAVRFTEELIA